MVLVFTAGVLLLALVHSLQVAGSSEVVLVLTAGVLLELVHSLQVAGSSEVVLVLTAGLLELVVLTMSAGVDELDHALQVWLSASEVVLVISMGLLDVVLSRTGVRTSTGSVEEDDSQGFQPSAETEPKMAAAAATVVAFISFALISEGFHEKIIFTLGKLRLLV